MIVISGERSILVRLFSGRLSIAGDGQRVGELKNLPRAEVAAVFFREDANHVIPDLLVVDSSSLQEFFAWCNTYLPHWSPLSAGMHIVERRKLLLDESRAASEEHPRRLLRGLLCVALGELLFEWQASNGQALPSVLSFRSTFGYAATCAAIRSRACIDDLLARWVRAQHLLQLTPRRIDPKTLKNVWAPLFAIAKPTLQSDQPQTVITELANAIAKKSQQTLFRHESRLIDTPRRREHIVIELENFIRDTKLVNSSECFEAAAIASGLSTSPVSHFDVLTDMANAEPRTLLWYSFLSGMVASEPASPVFENILYRIESDLRNQPNPMPDILLEELEALIGPQGQIPDGIGIGARFINVELDSGVYASFRLRREIPQTHSQVSQLDDRQLFEDLLEQLRVVFQRNSQFDKESGRQLRAKKTRRRRGR